MRSKHGAAQTWNESIVGGMTMAKLLERPFNREEKRQILDMLQGNINRISVSNNIEDIVCQLNFAVDRLSAVAYSRIKELKED